MYKVLILVLACCVIAAAGAEEQSTDGYRTVTRLYIPSPDIAIFYLDERCGAAKPYYKILPERLDVDRAYSTIMAAFLAGKTVNVKWIMSENGVHCEVERFYVE